MDDRAAQRGDLPILRIARIAVSRGQAHAGEDGADYVFLRSSHVLPSVFGYLAIALAVLFFAFGAIYMLRLTLPDELTALGAVQALWWLAALMLRSNR